MNNYASADFQEILHEREGDRDIRPGAALQPAARTHQVDAQHKPHQHIDDLDVRGMVKLSTSAIPDIQTACSLCHVEVDTLIDTLPH